MIWWYDITCDKSVRDDMEKTGDSAISVRAHTATQKKSGNPALVDGEPASITLESVSTESAPRIERCTVYDDNAGAVRGTRHALTCVE